MSDGTDCVFTVNEAELRYTLLRTDRRTLSITVDPDGDVEVRAPLTANTEAIERRLRRRHAWITEQQRRFAALRPRTPPRRYLTGETYRYLGRQLRLRHEPTGERGVQVEGDRLVVSGVRNNDAESTAEQLNRWFSAQAKRVFTERLAPMARRFELDQIAQPRLLVRRSQKRWGSMSRDGKVLTLNPRLVEAGPELIDYVLAHELAHVRHPDHGPDFVALLERRMPDWAERKARLERSLL